MTLLKETFKKLTFAVCAAFFIVTASSLAWAQTSVQNFGTGTGTYSSQTASTTFIPNPTSGTTYARAGNQPATATINLNNTSNPLGTAGAYVRGVAATNTSVSKFSPQVDYTGSPEFYTSFKVLFGNASAASGATSGIWAFYQGNGNMYSNNNDFSSADIFTGLRFTYGTSGTLALAYRTSSGFVTTGLTTTTFSQGVVYTIEIVGNNKTSGTTNYTYNGSAQNIAVQKFDLYINGTLIGNDLSAGELTTNTNIDSNTFIGSGSTSNVANIFVDDVITYNAVPSTIASGTFNFSLATFNGSEATTPFNLTINRTNGTGGSAIVNYTLADGTATGGSSCTAGVDYINPNGSSVIFANGVSSVNVPVQICPDTNVEPNETFTATITGVTAGASVGTTQPSTTATIENDDIATPTPTATPTATPTPTPTATPTPTPTPTPVPSFVINDMSITEGDTGTTNLVFTVTKTGANGTDSTINYTTANDTATAGSDYTTASGTLNFADSDTQQQISVPIVGDYVIEPTETFFVNLTVGTNATIADNQGVGTINDNDAAGIAQFSSATVSEIENTGNIGFTVTRTGGLASGTSATVTFANGTATGGATCAMGVDYINPAQTVSFNGGSNSTTFSVTVCPEAVYEGNETFTATLGSPQGGLAIGSPTTATATIINDDSAPTYSVNSISLNEGNGGTTAFTFTVTKNGTSELETTTTYSTIDDTASSASDYQAASGTLTFAATDLTKQFTVLVNGDTDVEQDETFFVTVGVTNPATGTGTILNDDVAATPTVSLSVTANSGTEAGTTAITVTATLSGGTATTDQTVTLGTSGTATLNSDYTLAGGNLNGTTLTIPANSTSGSTTFTVINDTEVEPDETAILTISNPSSGITLGTPVSQTITIVSDDAAVTTVSAPNCTGIASSPLTAGSTNKALLCFALTSNSNASFTALNVKFTTDPSIKFVNAYLYRSTDTDYATTTSDNVLVATGSINGTQFTFNGFSAFAETDENGVPSLSSTPTNFFVVADVSSAVTISTPATRPSVSPLDVTVSNGTVMGATATGQEYSFTAIATAANGVINGRVTNTRNRGLEGVTVTLSGGSLVEPIVVYTDQRGRYNFTEVPTGAIYTITVNSKRHTFNQPSTALNLTGNSENVNFVGEGW